MPGRMMAVPKMVNAMTLKIPEISFTRSWLRLAANALSLYPSVSLAQPHLHSVSNRSYNPTRGF